MALNQNMWRMWRGLRRKKAGKWGGEVMKGFELENEVFIIDPGT